MNFIKKNLFLIGCIVVIITALCGVFFIALPKGADLASKMDKELTKAKTATNLENKPIDIPGNARFTGVINQEVVQAKADIQRIMLQSKTRVHALAVQYNQTGRIDPRHPGVPMLGTFPCDKVLPKIDASSAWGYKFVDKYKEILTRRNPTDPSDTGPHWIDDLLATTVPTAIEISAEVQNRENQFKAQQQRNPNLNGGPLTGVVGDANSTKSLTEKVARDLILRNANNGKVYADENSFVIQPWVAQEGYSPNENDVFAAVVCTWLQQDVVNSIKEINASAANVGDAPVKRLIRIELGSDARSAAGASGGNGNNAGLTGQLFIGQAALAAAGPGGMAGPQPVAAQAASGNNFSAIMTGHANSAEYCTTLMMISVVIDPSHLNEFINTLYKQNNGYTVVDVQLETLDPYVEASNGYLYGKTQVVRVDIEVEALFFKDWLAPIMPRAYKDAMGITAGAPPAAAY